MEQDGFFSDAELASSSPPGCGAGCQLYQHCRSARMPVTGKGEKGILIVAEAPGEEEDVRGTQLIGKAGQRLRKELATFGIDLDRDCWKTNAVICHPPKDRSPTYTEICACRPNLLASIAKLEPTLVVLLGKAAMESAIGHSNPSIAFGKKRGFGLVRGIPIPEHTFGCWMLNTYHPSYVMRMDFDPSVPKVWHNELSKAFDCLDVDLPDLPNDAHLHCTQKPVQVEAFLRNRILKSKPVIAFDYETTGKKPFAKGHDVVSLGIAMDGHAWSFPLMGKQWNGVRKLWAEILEDSDIHKVAHNTAFERMWSEKIFGVDPSGWVCDTCVLAHVEDCRPSYSGLEVLSYLKLGAASYKDELKPYKGASKQDEEMYGANALNRMKDAPIDKLLQYNARDALYTLLIYEQYLKTGVSDGAVYG